MAIQGRADRSDESEILVCHKIKLCSGHEEAGNFALKPALKNAPARDSKRWISPQLLCLIK